MSNQPEIDYTSPYISEREYLLKKGVDLKAELQDDDNKSNKVKRFIEDITHFIMDYFTFNYACNELNRLTSDFSKLPEWRRKRFHFGMLEQIEYVLNNGLIHTDSGVNRDLNTILDMERIQISTSAMREFRLGAFANIKTAGSVCEIGDED